MNTTQYLTPLVLKMRASGERLSTTVKRVADENKWSYLIALNVVCDICKDVTKREKVEAFQLCKDDYEPSQRNAVWNFV